MGATLMLIVSTFLWGIWGFAQKQAVDAANPMTVQWMYTLPYLLAVPIWFWLGARTGDNLNGVAFRWAVLAGFAAIGATALFLFALRTTDASISVALTAAYPAVTLLLAYLAGQELLTPQKLLGIVVIIIGGVILTR